jgi:hypothetical protein
MIKVKIVGENEIIALQKELGVRIQYVSLTMFGLEFKAIKQDCGSSAAINTDGSVHSTHNGGSSAVYTIPAKYFEEAIEGRLSRDIYDENLKKFKRYFPLYGIANS